MDKMGTPGRRRVVWRLAAGVIAVLLVAALARPTMHVVRSALREGAFAKLTPANARLKVDNVETRPGPDSLLKVAPGSHVVVVRATGYRKATRTISATLGDTTTLEIELVQSQANPAPQAETPVDSTMGTIVLNGTLPTGAELRVDGNVATPASGVLTVTPGSHWISISVPGYATDSAEVFRALAWRVLPATSKTSRS